MHWILFWKSRTFDFFFPHRQFIIGFHKRLKITSIDFHKRLFLGRNKKWDSGLNSGTKVCKHQNGI